MCNRQGPWLGPIQLATPIPLVWATLIAMALIAAVVVFAAFGRYTRRANVFGQLVPSAGLLSLPGSSSGTITRVYVEEGQNVRKGEPLVEISSEQTSAKLGVIQSLVSSQLRSEATRMHLQLGNQRRVSAQQVAGLHDKIDMLHDEIIEIDSEIVDKKKTAERADKFLTKLRPLLKMGYVSEYQMEEKEAAAMQAHSQIKELSRQRLDTMQQISQAQQQLLQLPYDLAEKQYTIEGLLSKNSQLQAQNELQRGEVVRAPVDGMVSALLIKSGQAVTAGQPLLSVLPKDSLLQAQFLVPSSAIGFVSPGNRVVMRYQAFPYQKFGQQYGSVASVSRSALSADEIKSLLGPTTSSPLYRVIVTLDRQTIDSSRRTLALKPGMAVSADILLDRRRLWQWVFEPLEGMREQLQSAPEHKN
ncbi:MAG: hypothetical protein ABS82_02765 [Rhodanobacter sp. SCN 67-45]|nr:MAG: hypothetical protein ABS82_02765 [Rhodanobacter sp. SCN 67-45]